MMQQPVMTPQDVDIALAQLDAQETELERLQEQGQAISPAPWQYPPFPAQAMQQGTGGWGTRRSRGSYLLAGAAVIAGLYMLDRFSDSLRPVTVGAAKEGMAFKDWLAKYTGGTRKKFRGVTVEAEKAREKEKKKRAASSAKERELLKKLDKHLKKLEKELEEKGSL
jgi:hypothetical protein